MNDPGSNHGLTAESIRTTFPIALQEDSSAAALADVTARLLARRPEEIDRLRIYPDVFRLDDKLLDILAYDFKVDWWDPNYTTEEKRRTLADSWHVHKMLGTRAAVETAIRAIYPKTEVQEWFEYGGDPYHFKLLIDVTGEIVSEKRPQQVIERVNFYKSLRSHLDAVVTTAAMEPVCIHPTPLFLETSSSSSLPTLEPVFPGNLLHVTPVLGRGMSLTAIPVLEPVFPIAAIIGRASAAAQSITETALPALKENDTTVMPELIEHATAAVQTVTETALPFLEELPPHDMRAVQRISVRPLLPVTETRLPRLEDFSTTITAVCKGKATAALQNISETRLPELEE